MKYYPSHRQQKHRFMINEFLILLAKLTLSITSLIKTIVFSLIKLFNLCRNFVITLFKKKSIYRVDILL